MTTEELLATLKDMSDRIKIGDSWEGNIEYMMPDDNDGEGDTDFMVRGVYRIGNSEGQGGMRMIGTVPSM